MRNPTNMVLPSAAAALNGAAKRKSIRLTIHIERHRFDVSVRRWTKVSPDLSVDRSRVSETVSTAMFTGMNGRLSSIPGMESSGR